MYLIWSYEHDAWWRPNNFGYTKSIEEAGQYTEDEALEIVQNANKFGELNETMLKIDDIVRITSEDKNDN